MLNRRARLSSAALMFALLSILPAGRVLGEEVMLKRTYVPGRTSYIEIREVVDMEISGLPMPPMKFHTKQLYGLWEKVESATSDRTRIVLTYDRAARNVEAAMMGDVEFDTDDPEYEEAAPQLGTVLKPMIGMVLTMELDKNGKVVSFSGMDAIYRKISDKAVASMHWEQMKEDFSNERGAETLGTEPLLIYPNKKVKVGDTWKARFSISRPMVGTIVTDYQYKVDRIGTEDGRKIVAISVAGAVSKGADAKKDTDTERRTAEEEAKKDGDANQGKPKTPEPQAEVSGSLSGVALFDVELGRIVKRTNKGRLDIKVPLSKVIPGLPAGEEPQFASFSAALDLSTSILTEEVRNAQKAEARKKVEMRRKAEDDDDEEEEDDD